MIPPEIIQNKKKVPSMSHDTLNTQTTQASHESDGWDDFEDYSTSAQIEKTRTPDVPVKRGLAKRALYKALGKAPEMVSLDGAKDIMFTPTYDPSNPDTHARIVLEREALESADAQDVAHEAAKRKEEAAQVLARAQEDLTRLRRNRPANADLDSPAGHAIRKGYQEKIDDAQIYVNRMQYRYDEAATQLESASDASFSTGQKAELEEHWQLEQKKRFQKAKPGLFRGRGTKNIAAPEAQIDTTERTEEDW
jgi:hypothetical protein